MREINTKRRREFTPALNTSGVLPGRSTRQPLEKTTHASAWPRFDHNFSQVRAHTDMRGGSAQDPFGDMDDRFGAGVEDPVHQSMIDRFRERQGQPPGGVDDMGNQVGPADAEIKYRPQPIAVLNGPFHAPIDTVAAAGMEIAITVVMSSNNAELRFVQDSEVVGTSFDHTGSATSLAPFTSSNSDFMPAANIPNDRHTSGRARIIDLADNQGGSGSYSRHQLDIYNHARYGIFNPLAIPNSGYKITRSIIAGPGTRVRFRVDKTAEACTVGNYSTQAGPSPAQHDEVVIRA